MHLRFFFTLFCWRDKRFLSEFLKKWGWFQGHNGIVSPNILPENENVKNLRHGFKDQIAMIKTTLISSCHCKTHILFCLQKTWKRVFNNNNELSQDRAEKQIMPCDQQ